LRYVSHSPKYTLGYGEVEQALVNGMPVVTKDKTTLKFQQGLALDHELAEALKTFTFRGLPDGVPPEVYISVFDTRDYQKEKGLSDDEREALESFIERLPSFNVDYIRVDEIRAPKPWPSYDNDSEEEILSAIERFQFDADDVRRYEQENENRSSLLEKLVDLGASDVQRTDLDELHSATHENLELTDARTGAKKTVVVQA
jgi:hypothetical protein